MSRASNAAIGMKRKQSLPKSKRSAGGKQGNENHAPSADLPRTIRRTANGGVAYSDELVSGICERLRLGEHLAHILASADMPTTAAFYQWLDARPNVLEAYRHAREGQAATWAHEIVEISDTCKTSDEINRARLRVDARKWVASKLIPRVYGDRVQTEIGRPGEFEAIDSARLLAEAIAARLGSPKLLEAQAIDITED